MLKKRTSAFGLTSVSRAVFGAAVNRLNTGLEREKLRSRLHSLSNRDLDDIGINRAEVEAIVRGEHPRCEKTS